MRPVRKKTTFQPAPFDAATLPPRGLPEHLPANERLLWQGAPDWRAMARNVFHVRGLALYFGVILAWCVVSAAMDGQPPMTFALSIAQLLAAAAAPFAIIALYSWLVARTTTYTITSERVVMRLGLALPLTINLPYRKIDSAAVKVARDGSGDISLLLSGSDRLAYLILWPHARPWRTAKAEPTLRAIPDAARVGQILARALAASANLPAPAMADQPAATQGQQQAVPAY